MKLFARILAVAILTMAPTSALAAGPSGDTAVTLQISESSVSALVDGVSTSTSTQGSEALIVSTGDFDISKMQNSPLEIRLTIDIQDSNAPTEYAFRVPGLCSMDHFDAPGGGLNRLVSCGNETLGWLAAPWATDASGREISTSFRAENDTLIQSVSHRAASTIYPVQADPYLGIDLIDRVTYTYSGSHPQPDVSVHVTPWMGTVYAYLYLPTIGYDNAVDVAIKYGWPEVRSKLLKSYGSYALAYVDSHVTYHDQYACHAFGAPVIFVSSIFGLDPRPSWDFEGYRTPNSDVLVWISSRCSW